MLKTFITTIEVYPENLNTTINDYLLKSLKTKYNNTCLNGCLIKNVTEIIKRGSIVSPRNDFSGICTCDIQFLAEYKTYEQGDMLVVTITSIEDDSIFCKTEEYSIYIKADTQFKPQIGCKFICIISNISYEIGNIINMTARIYKPAIKCQISECINSHTQDIIITQSIMLCLKKITELNSIIQKNKYATLILDILSKGYKSSKLIFDKFTYNAELDYLKFPEGPIYFIISPNDIISSGTFRIAPISTPESMLSVDAKILIFKDPVSLQTKFYKFIESVCNYLESIIELSKFNSETEYNNNSIVWEFYESISKN